MGGSELMTIAELRRDLLELRGQALDALAAGGIDPEMLAVLSSSTAALDALDRLPAASAPVSRAVVADDAGAVRLIVFDEAGGAASVSLTAPAAIGLAGRLLQAAELRTAVKPARSAPKAPAAAAQNPSVHP
jgi:hypothetical protein